MDAKYKYLCEVKSGVRIHAATTSDCIAFVGDLVVLNNGERGTVAKVVIVNTEDEDYAIFTDFVQVHEIVEVYRRTWGKEKESEEA